MQHARATRAGRRLERIAAAPSFFPGSYPGPTLSASLAVHAQRSVARTTSARETSSSRSTLGESGGPPVVDGSLTSEAECSIWLAPVGNTPLSVLQYEPAARDALAEATASGVSWKVDPAGETLQFGMCV